MRISVSSPVSRAALGICSGGRRLSVGGGGAHKTVIPASILLPMSVRKKSGRAKPSDPPSFPARVGLRHGAVPGRGRYSVDGLYRSAAMRATLEHGLAGDAQVTRARIDLRTGNLLVEFDRALSHAEMAWRIDRLLAGKCAIPKGAKKQAPAREKKAGGGKPPPVHESPGAKGHAVSAEEALAAVASRREGLGVEEAASRLREHGPNELPVAKPRSDLAVFIDQFKSLPVAMLGGSAAMSLATGSPLDALVTLGVVGANGGIGYAMESGAEKTIHDITGRGEHRVLVRREGAVRDILSREVVPGDVVVLTPGAFIEADARIVEAVGLTVDESSLTGESVPVSKHAGTLDDRDAPLGERANSVFRGTIVDGGSGLAVVMATGADTEIGRIQALTGEARPPQTPIERELERMGRHLVYLSLGVCGGVFALGVARGLGTMPMLKSAVALAVAAVPEGLPAIATSTLALGLGELKKKNVLVRRLEAVEGLGSLNVLCFDKTGTLTQNSMTVESLLVGAETLHLGTDGFGTEDGHADLKRHEMKKFLEVAALCSEVKIEENGNGPLFHGSPTEVALVDLAARGGVDVAAVRGDNPVDRVAYRTESRKFMVSRHHRLSEEKISLAVKGSPDQVLQRCRVMEVNGSLAALDGEARSKILAENERFASEGLRVLGLAYSHDPANAPEEPKDLIWLGLVAMKDPLRGGMADLMAEFHKAGIRTVMITGDQPATAYAIAREVGLAGAAEPVIVDAAKLDGLSPEAFRGTVAGGNVFARVSPARKLEIIRALQETGMRVGMTGDGINDGPALRAADVGIAMGQGGAQSAQDVADVVIRDDDLTTLGAGIAQGRATYANIRKAIHFLLATNLSEIAIVAAETMAPGDQLESPMEMFWINLVTDILPALGLALEEPEQGIMSVPPRDPEAPMFTADYYKMLASEAGIISAASLAAHGYGLLRYGPGPRTRSITFSTLIGSQLLFALSCRHDRFHGLSGGGLFGNKYLNGTLTAAGALQILPLAWPPLRRLLGLAPIGISDGLVIGGSMLASFAGTEYLLARRTMKNAGPQPVA